jgi:hypothetical protein
VDNNREPGTIFAQQMVSRSESDGFAFGKLEAALLAWGTSASSPKKLLEKCSLNIKLSTRRRVGTFRFKRGLLLLIPFVFVVLLMLVRRSRVSVTYMEDTALPREVLKFAKLTSDDNGYVQLLFFNLGYVELVNSWICNVRLIDTDILRQTLFVAADQEAAAELSETGPWLNIYTHESDMAASVTYGTYAYFKLTLDRLLIQNTLVQAGANVLVVEADAVWFSPIAEYLSQMVGSNRIISANDRTPENPLISAGFLFFPSKEKKFFQDYVSRYASRLEKFKDFTGRFDDIDAGEQHLMTKLLQRRKIAVQWLAECHFSRGEWYDDSLFRARCPHPKVIQNNYISGNNEKMRRAKQWGHWFLNEDRTCVSDLPIINPLGDYDTTCEAALKPLSSHIAGVRLSQSVIEILSLVDHSYILTVDGCQKTSLPSHLKRKITCVIGSKLDRCLLKSSHLGYTDYSERAGFTHAFVHLYSKKRDFMTIAVLEQDYLVERTIDQQQLENMQKLLQSKLWTFVRVGHRPYFLEGLTYPETCPLQCVCEKINNFGSNLCYMRESGCDMRSIDFYIASHRVFSKFAERVYGAVKYPWQHVDGRVSPSIKTRYPLVDVNVIQSFKDQWYVLPQLSFQVKLRDLDETFNQQQGKIATIHHQEHLEMQFNQLCVP